MNDVKVSVIIPVYNVEQYLRQCIDSVLDQTLSDIEIIVVDDGSTDNSGKICDEYGEKHKSIKVVHKKNGGLGSARNCGLNYAKGEFFFLLDSDDWLCENALERLYFEAKKNKLDIIFCGADVIYEDDNNCENLYFKYNRTKDIGIVRNGAESLNIVYDGQEYYASVCLRLYNTDFYKRNNFFFNEEHIHEDESVGFLSYLNAERVEIIPDKLYKRRVRSGSIMTEKTIIRSFDGYSYAWSELRNYVRNCRDPLHIMLLNRRMFDYTMMCLGMHHTADKKDKKSIRKKCREMCRYAAKGNSPKRIKIAAVSIKLYDYLFC